MTTTKKVLVLFSGTGSIEKGLDNYMLEEEKMDIEYRGVDINNKFKPFYNVDILKWDYQEALKDFIPDYLHSSFVCCEFSQLKNTKNHTRNLDLGFSLINKTFEIYDYLKHINPNLIMTCENPRNKYARGHERLLLLNRFTTCYCKYGFKYMKPTDFWCNKTLTLEMCAKKTPCPFRKEHGYHEVCLGFKGKKPLQISDSKYFSKMRKAGLIEKGFNNTYMRYRIPKPLCNLIVKQVMNQIPHNTEVEEVINDLVNMVISNQENPN